MATCEVPDEVIKAFLKFKTSRSTANRAILMKINREELKVEVEDVIEDLEGLEDLIEELPDGSPRYIAYATKIEMNDGRMTYPLCFIYYNPATSIALGSLYASTKPRLWNKLDAMKSYDVRHKDEMTDEWLEGLLKK